MLFRDDKAYQRLRSLIWLSKHFWLILWRIQRECLLPFRSYKLVREDSSTRLNRIADIEIETIRCLGRENVMCFKAII